MEKSNTSIPIVETDVWGLNSKGAAPHEQFKRLPDDMHTCAQN